MSYDSTNDFLIDLDDIPDLPRDERGEWVHHVFSRWIDGVFFNDRQDPNMTVALERVANNEEGFDDIVLLYEVAVRFGADVGRLQALTMNPQSAIDLGHHLIAAGAAAMRDMGKHSWFLTKEPIA